MLFVSLAVQCWVSIGVWSPNTTGSLTFCQRLSKVWLWWTNDIAPFLLGIPVHLCCLLALHPLRKCHRRKGKRSGRLVRVKVCLEHTFPLIRGLSIEWCPTSLFLFDCWTLSMPGWYMSSAQKRWSSPNVCRVPLKVSTTDPPAVRNGLMNARSLANKTLILKDFFTSKGLDWGVGESSFSSELLPNYCSYLNSLWISGRGGGIAIVYKNVNKCKQLLLPSLFSSFELRLFELGRFHKMLCAVVYWPPRYHKVFINDFSGWYHA